MMRRYGIWIGIVLVLALAGVGAAAALRPYTLHGSVIDPATPAPDFSLPLAQGGDFKLSDQRGKVVMVFFGFTNCMDICPGTLSQWREIVQRLGADAGKVQVVFITVDPGRDTPAVTARYAAGFDPSFVGLSGSEQQLGPVWQAYGVYHKLDKTSPTDTQYNVEHSTQMYIIDRAGNLRLTYANGTPTDDMLQDVRYLLR
jgi:protein SCO1/2